MKKQIYLIKFIDDSEVLCQTRHEIIKKIDEWLEKNDGQKHGYYGLTIHMIDGLRYKRVLNKEKHKFIKSFSACYLKDLVTIDRRHINLTGAYNRPYDQHYINKQETRLAKKEFDKMVENNTIDYSKFQTLI
jgi:hypothetical protein